MMREKERILMECRYLLSINKTYDELAHRLKISKDVVYDDLNNKLEGLDSLLYERVKKVLKKNNNS